MGFRGLDFGSGLSHFGDLMAKGYQDQIALKRQMIQDSQAAQAANMATGWGEDDPTGRGINMVSSPDLSQLGGPAAGTPAPAPAPASAPPPPPLPMTGAAGTPTDISQVPSAPATTDVDANTAGIQAHQMALQHMVQNHPDLALTPTGQVTPWAAKNAMVVAEKAAALQESKNRYQQTIEGYNIRAQAAAGASKYRTDNSGGGDDSDAAHLQLARLRGLQQEQAHLNSTVVGQSAAGQARNTAITTEIKGILDPSGASASPSAPAAPSQASAPAPSGAKSRPDGDYYSAKQNKTYTYKDGVQVKVVDGHI